MIEKKNATPPHVYTYGRGTTPVDEGLVKERESRTHVAMQRSMNGTIGVSLAKSSEAPSLCREQAEESSERHGGRPDKPCAEKTLDGSTAISKALQRRS